MTKNVLYAVMMVSSFGVYSVSLAMDKKSVVTRGDKNYLTTANQNLEDAEKVDQSNLTVLKKDIEKTEKKLKVRPLNFDQGVFPVVEGRNVKGRNSDNSFLKRKRIGLTADNKKEQNKKIKLEKKAENDRVEALELAAFLQGKKAFFDSFDDFQLEEVIINKRNPSFGQSSRTNAQPIIYNNDVNFEPVLDNSSPMMPTTQNDSKDDRVLKSQKNWTPTATGNLNNAIDGNMDNTTALKSMIRHNEKTKAKKAIALNLDSSSSSEDKS